MIECDTGYRVPKRVRDKVVRCPTLGCPGRLKAGHRPEKDSPVLVRCLDCNIHFEIRNPRSFG